MFVQSPTVCHIMSNSTANAGGSRYDIRFLTVMGLAASIIVPCLFIYYIKRLLIIRETLVATRPPFPPPVPFSSYFLRLSTTLWLSGYEMRTLSRHISSRQRALPYMWQRRPSDLESVRSATHGILSHPNGSRLSTSSTLVSSLYGEDVHRPPLAHTAPARTWDFPMDRGPVLYSVS